MRHVLLALTFSLAACGASGESADSEPDGEATAGSDIPRERPEVRVDPPDEVAAIPSDAEVTASGLASRVLYPGHGTDPAGPNDRVTIHYTGWNTEGQRVDSSVVRGGPSTLNVGRVIEGFTEGLQLMVEGERRRLWIPASLAYEGRDGPQGMLVFDVELLSIDRAPPAPETPPDVAAPPRDAERSESGLAWIVLEPGTGTEHPTESSEVTVHYSGWRAETGALFDSSITRQEPATFPLSRVIAGWTEGVQLMVVGERRRFWIPQELAYQGRPGPPAGVLVFDIELISFQ